MRAVVTGAGGFAGAWLARALLARGHAVVAWVRRPPEAPEPGLRYRVQDVTDAPGCARALAEDAPDWLFHLAAMAHPGDAEAAPARAEAVNVQGTVNVLAPLPPDARAVLASTCHVYGPPRRLPVAEDHPLDPRGAYARSKALAEVAARGARPGVIIARAFHHLGPGQSTRYALADWAAQLAARRREGRRDPLVVGDVDLKRDYCDVRDVAEGYITLAERAPEGAVVNLCRGEAPSLRALLMALMGDDPLPVQVDPARLRPGQAPELRGDPGRARDLGWTPRRALDASLRELAEAALRSPR